MQKSSRCYENGGEVERVEEDEYNYQSSSVKEDVYLFSQFICSVCAVLASFQNLAILPSVGR